MKIKEIQFSNGRSVFLSGDAPSLHPGNDTLLLISNIIKLNIIKTAYVLVPADKFDSTKSAFEQYFPGLHLIILDAAKIQSADMDYVASAIEGIKNSIKTANSLLLFSDKTEVPFLYCLRINPVNPAVPGKLSGIDAAGKAYIKKYIEYIKNKKEAFFENDRESPLKSGFSIRKKLISIISLIVIFSLGTVILLASYLYKNYSEILIQEYNLSLARLIGKSMEDRFTDIIYRTSQISTVLQKTSKITQPQIKDSFFRDNKDIVVIANASIKSGKIMLDGFFANSLYLNEYRIDSEKLKNEIVNNSSITAKAFSGKESIRNVSTDFGFPAVSIAFPAANNSATVVYLSSASLLEVFQHTRQTELIELFIVSPDGSAIAHSNDEQVNKEMNLSEIPIVNSMFSSQSSNGSKKYIMNGVEYLGSYQTIELFDLGIVSTVESSKIMEAVHTIQYRNILIMLLILTIAVLLIYFFSKTISIPIIRLAKATMQIEHGNYDISVPVTTNDEIGILTKSFSAMARGLREKEIIKEAFGKFVNPKIAEKAISGGLKLGGENRIATIFFSDIRGFTNMSEKLEPHEIVVVLNRYFTKMIECVNVSGGIVDKFIGDAIMAHWGAIEVNSSDAFNSVKAALLMRKALLELNRIFAQENKPIIKIGCGINTGPVIAGQIGSEERHEYTVIGDAVNLASRIEYLNKNFGTDILISDSTAQLVREQFLLVEMPEVMIRGKEKPQIVHAVLGYKNDAETPKSLTELRSFLGIEFDTVQAQQEFAKPSDELIGKMGANDEN